MNAHDRTALLDALLDGSITEAELLQVEAELSVDAELRQQYYRRVQLDLLLQREAAEAGIKPSTKPASVMRSRRSRNWIASALLAVAACLGLALAWPEQAIEGEIAHNESVSSPAVEPSANGFAILQGQSDAVWKESSVAEGDLLPLGELHLASGRIHVELFSGVQMVIEGESRFSIDSPMQVTMASGRARTHVPEPAQGFRIKTASGDVVDLGTEFTLDVDGNGADVTVVEGEVELHPNAHDRNSQDAGAVVARRIETGDALRIDASGAIADSLKPTAGLIGPGEFQQLLQQRQGERFARWNGSLDRLQADPRLVAYYRFQPAQDRSRQLPNLAAASHGPETHNLKASNVKASNVKASNGAIVAAAPAVDRWGRNGAALDFSRVGSRVRVNVPGEQRGLTMMCWVKINSLDRWYNSLLLTDGHESREPHWQIMDDGRVFFSVKLPEDASNPDASRQPIYYSPDIWDASLSGRWIQLAVTYDVDAKQVTHYLNGTPISTEAISDDALVDSITIGRASICNWSEPMYRTDAKFVLRNLNGSMDEFAIYRGALSAAEIEQLYREGNPNDAPNETSNEI